jgi:hypothetical protein
VTGTQDDSDDRRPDITAAVLKILGVAVVIGLAIGIGAWVVVKALGLNAPDSTGTASGQVQPLTPLPTTALPVPSDTSSPSGGVPTSTPTVLPTGALYLSASPVMVRPMERINLTGQWPGHDNESLLVQRFEGGGWSDFGVQASVKLGTFETYVMTGRTGDQRFRVFDPHTQTASNEVTVTVGS